MTTMQKETIRTFIVIGILVIVGLIGAKLVDRYTATPAPNATSPSPVPSQSPQATTTDVAVASATSTPQTVTPMPQFATGTRIYICPTSTQPESKEWQTFSDEHVGLSFSYPKEWFLTSYATATDPGAMLQSPESKNEKPGIDNYAGEMGDMHDFSVFVSNDFRSYASHYPGDAKEKDNDLGSLLADQNVFEGYLTGTILIDDSPAYEVLYGGFGQSYGAIAQHDDRIYEFEFATADNKTCLTPDQKKILSSIRFLK